LSFVFLIYLGIKYLVTASLPATTPTVEAVEHKLHPHTAFWIGFVRVLGNPAVLLFWITVSATFISHEWIQDTFVSKAVCVFGTFIGGLLWFVLLSFLVAKGHGKFSTKALVRMAHISGAILLFAGVAIGFRLINLLALHPRG
jgi:threonine/homoserine/homoserine lactone efflux protein